MSHFVVHACYDKNINKKRCKEVMNESRITQQEINDTLQEILKYCGMGIRGVGANNEIHVDIALGIENLHYQLGEDFLGRSFHSSYNSPCPSINRYTPTPALMFLAEKILNKERYKKITSQTSTGKILYLIKEEIWEELLLDEWQNDVLVSGGCSPSGDIRITTNRENTNDAICWYAINNDGSGRVSHCQNFEGTSYGQKTFDPVINLAKELRKKETKWQKFINKIFHHGNYIFSSRDAMILLDEIINITNKRENNVKTN